MSGYKVVPMEPTQEMIEAAKDAYMPFGDMDIALRMAALAAPAVQGEPVALPPFATKIIEKLRRFDVCAEDGQDVDIGRHWLDMLVQLGLLNRVQRSPALWEMAQQGEDVLEGYTAPQPAEQQPAPDVAALVEALERCKFALLKTSVSCQKGVVRVCCCRQCAYDSAHTVLAAHRKRGDA